MNLSDFRRAGHAPTLFSAFLYFDVSFMVWLLPGALANSIVAEFGLSDAQKGLMVAVPLLGGAVLRLVLGLLADRIGARRTAMLGMASTAAPLLLGWLWADSYPRLLLVGLLLGVAGASFAAALPLASRWYPPRLQGLAMGIAGAGNSGTAIATFFGPRLAAVWGWRAVFGLALIPLLATFVLFALLAKDSPNQPTPRPLRAYLEVLRRGDAWWFCLLYSITFGGFVGLASFLNVFFLSQYGLSPVAAGGFATLCVIAGSALRPVGGHLADRLGGVRLLTALFLAAGGAMLGLATLPPLAAGTTLLFAAMAALGMGNGAVFQLVPQRFPREIGVTTGVVGAAGGLGGFFLPTMLGAMKQATGSYSGGFLAFALIGGLGGAAALAYASRGWRGIFIDEGGRAAEPSCVPLPVAAEATGAA
ncbi:MFS transporter [Planctomyces sp. SH-PL62]|uniref:MFS transporter n=1 Tax=Planctomyces sp. SH-PL62 TaxID=1636152 RepID=UPI00078CCA6B|nr:MFS transporter [Planctomyces sp. SH-PL62]AMV38399.1 Nitrate transporter [Planctomyces sp. SH-PL62]